MGIKLLEDCRTAFATDDRVPTEHLLHRLHALPESPWNNIRGKLLDDRGLAIRLRKYEIKPKLIRIGANVSRGYDCADFADAWARYLSPVSSQ